jgi:hypothetical protein
MTPAHRETLIHRHLDGIATPAEVDALSRLLETDAAARAEYIDLAHLAATLRTDDSLRLASAEAAPASGPAAPYPKSWFTGRSWLAAAAAVVLCAAGFWWTVREPSRRTAVFAEVTAIRDAAIAGSGVEPVVGARIELGALRLERGELTLRLESGVRLEFLGPAEAQFENPMRLRLERGKLNADAGEHGKGFTVVTPSGSIVDLGTRFAVDASANDKASVVVFSGQVQVQPATALGKPAARLGLFEGEAVHLRKDAVPERWQSVRLSPSTSEALERAEAGGDLVEVRDNLTDAEVRRFYAVVRGGMSEGARAFTGVPGPVWQATPDQPFPEELIGADVVKTFLTDKRRVDFTLTLTLDGPSHVYVLHDMRRPPPAWLARDFTDTGARIECGPWDPKINIVASDAPLRDGKVFLACSVWRRTVTTAATVVLGPPRDPGVSGRNLMYGVAVRPLSP